MLETSAENHTIREMIYTKTTHDIEISVKPVFLEDQSMPEKNYYVWSYHVKILNNRKDPIRLQTRYWQITDATGVVQEIEGEGVVGEQPVIHGGCMYEYTSGAPLNTPSGIMVGTYGMLNDDDSAFNVEIPAFSLDSPHQSHVLH